MSFRLFTYYSAAWGAAAALFGWVLGRIIGSDPSLLGAAMRGFSLGLCLALGLALVDALASGTQRTLGSLSVRVAVPGLIGAVGGAFGGFLGEALVKWTDLKALLILGWTIAGLLIGVTPSIADYLSSVMRKEDRRGSRRKVRNGLIGGAAGGLIGGIVAVIVPGILFSSSAGPSLWSPTAVGFVALGASIGLALALAQILLREASLRVESGIRPGRQLLLTRPETSIGCAESCDVGLPGDTTIEAVHAKIAREGDSWLLSDAGTSSGTLLNGRRIGGPTLLHTGDRIQVGGSVLSFEVKTRESAAPPTVVPVATVVP